MKVREESEVRATSLIKNYKIHKWILNYIHNTSGPINLAHFFFFLTPYSQEYFQYFLHQFASHFSSIELEFNVYYEKIENFALRLAMNFNSHLQLTIFL